MRRVLLLLTLFPAAALANGRFPQTTSVTFSPTENETLLVGSTFGLLVSHDDGGSWRWVCEAAVGYNGIFDPVYVISPTGAYFATTVDGLAVSRDNGCTWSKIANPGVPDAGLPVDAGGDSLNGQWVADAAVASDGTLWIVTSSGGQPNDAYVSTDDGKSFSAAMIPEAPGAWWKTVRVAPSDKNRIYVSGYRVGETSDAGAGAPIPLLYRTDNGKDWTNLPFSYQGQSQLRLLAVSSADPNLLFARTDDEPTDTLLRSDDGGMSFTAVLTFDNNLSGFFERKDGTFVAGSMYRGVQFSTDAGKTWNSTSQSPRMACAGARPSDGALFSCGANWTPDMFALARSTDAQSWSKLFRFSDLKGPIECPNDSQSEMLCGPIWPMLATQFGIGGADAGPPHPDAGKIPDRHDGGPCGCGVTVGMLAVFASSGRTRKRRAR